MLRKNEIFSEHQGSKDSLLNCKYEGRIESTFRLYFSKFTTEMLKQTLNYAILRIICTWNFPINS